MGKRDRRRVVTGSGEHETRLGTDDGPPAERAEPDGVTPPPSSAEAAPEAAPEVTPSRRRLTAPSGDAATVGIVSPGQVLNDHYRLMREIARGGMGIVYEAEDVKIAGRRVAVKVLPPEVAKDRSAVLRLQREASAVCLLDHPAIVRLIELNADGEVHYLVMEYLNGDDLAYHLASHERLPLDEVLDVARQVCPALSYAHGKGVLHRDIKPANLMFKLDGDHRQVKVTDFGIASQVKDSMTRLTGQESAGTLLYIAPEQLRGAKPSAASDQYSLAATLYELLSGEPPFTGGGLSHQILEGKPAPLADVPAHVNDAIMRALSKEPEGRFGGCGAFLDALEGRSAAGVPGRTTAGRSRASRVTVAVFALVVAVLVTWGLGQRGGAGQSGAGGPGGAGGVTAVPSPSPTPALGITSVPVPTTVAVLPTPVGATPSAVAPSSAPAPTIVEVPSPTPALGITQVPAPTPVVPTSVAAPPLVATPIPPVTASPPVAEPTEAVAPTPTPPPVPRTVRVSFESDPPGAKVFGVELPPERKYLGRTGEGTVAVDLEPGTWTFKYVLAGFRDAVETVVVGADPAPRTVRRILRPEQGAIEVSVLPADATVTVDGVALELEGGHAWVAVKPGSHRMAATRVGYEDAGETVTVADRGVGSSRLVLKERVKIPAPVLQEQLGFIEVSVQPADAVVCFDDVRQTLNGGRARWRVKPGTHRLSATRAGFEDLSATVWVTVGATVECRLELKEKPKGPAAGTIWTNSLGMRFAWCPPGEFLMGSSPGEPGRREDEGPAHQVRVSTGFFLGVCEVTQGQWQTVMGANPSAFSGDGRRPVEKVFWSDCQVFARRLAGRDGNAYRLPTEAEWEYACRAGTSTPVYAGSFTILGEYSAPALDPIAWYVGNSSSTHPRAVNSSRWPGKQIPHVRAATQFVGGKRPNAWGLYDMLGNVWEWCQDVSHGSYAGAPADGSAWEAGGVNRVLRGGAWFSPAGRVRAATRGVGAPEYRNVDVGLRLVAMPRGR